MTKYFIITFLLFIEFRMKATRKTVYDCGFKMV